HLALPRREQAQSRLDRSQLTLFITASSVHLKRMADRRQHLFLLKWLGQELNSSRLKHLANHGNITMRGHEYDGDADARADQSLLKFDSCHAGKTCIQHQAAWTVG